MTEKKNKFIVFAQFNEEDLIDTFIVEAVNHEEAYHRAATEHGCGNFIIFDKIQIREFQFNLKQLLRYTSNKEDNL
jgi:hypothetical protein